MNMMKKVNKKDKGVAEIIGTVMFLVILIFYFTNVYLWHDTAARKAENLVTDRMNSGIRLETISAGGAPVHASGENILYSGGETGVLSDTHQIDTNYRTLTEKDTDPSYAELYLLDVEYTFNTGVISPEQMRVISAIHISIRASMVDPAFEGCYVAILDVMEDQWIDAGMIVMTGFRLFNATFSPPDRYIEAGTGVVTIRIVDAIGRAGGGWLAQPDPDQGTLSIDFIEVRAEHVAMKVTNLGGLDVSIARVWIINSTTTFFPLFDHIYADIEPHDYWISAGASRIIELDDVTIWRDNPPDNSDPAVTVTVDLLRIIIHYVPPADKNVIFKVITRRGNSAACSYHFPNYE